MSNDSCPRCRSEAAEHGTTVVEVGKTRQIFVAYANSAYNVYCYSIKV